MNKIYVVTVCTTVALLGIGCSPSPSERRGFETMTPELRLALLAQDKQRLEQEVAELRTHVRPAGSVSHVVVFWLKSPGDVEGRKALIRSAVDIRSITGVLDVSAGEVMKSDRTVVDSTYDAAMIVTFQDASAMRQYVEHPIHRRLLKEVLQPYVDHYKVFDFKN